MRFSEEEITTSGVRDFLEAFLRLDKLLLPTPATTPVSTPVAGRVALQDKPPYVASAPCTPTNAPILRVDPVPAAPSIDVVDFTTIKVPERAPAAAPATTTAAPAATAAPARARVKVAAKVAPKEQTLIPAKRSKLTTEVPLKDLATKARPAALSAMRSMRNLKVQCALVCRVTDSAQNEDAEVEERKKPIVAKAPIGARVSAAKAPRTASAAVSALSHANAAAPQAPPANEKVTVDCPADPEVQLKREPRLRRKVR